MYVITNISKTYSKFKMLLKYDEEYEVILENSSHNLVSTLLHKINS